MDGKLSENQIDAIATILGYVGWVELADDREQIHLNRAMVTVSELLDELGRLGTLKQRLM